MIYRRISNGFLARHTRFEKGGGHTPLNWMITIENK